MDGESIIGGTLHRGTTNCFTDFLLCSWTACERPEVQDNTRQTNPLECAFEFHFTFIRVNYMILIFFSSHKSFACQNTPSLHLCLYPIVLVIHTLFTFLINYLLPGLTQFIFPLLSIYHPGSNFPVIFSSCPTSCRLSFIFLIQLCISSCFRQYASHPLC